MTKQGEITRIRYDEGCLAAHALNMVGDRWALLVVRELMFAPKRFQGLRAGMPGITAAVLTQRLQQLIHAGVVTQDPQLGHYALRASGRGLLPVLQAMCHWGATHPGHDPRRFISPSGLIISMTAMIDRAAAAGESIVAGMQIAQEGFVLRLGDDGSLLPKASADPGGDFVLHGDGNRLARAAYGAEPVGTLVDRGIIGASGDLDAAQRFLDLFALRR